MIALQEGTCGGCGTCGGYLRAHRGDHCGGYLRKVAAAGTCGGYLRRLLGVPAEAEACGYLRRVPAVGACGGWGWVPAEGR